MLMSDAAPETHSPPDRPLILVVDDEMFMRTIISDALGDAGFEVLAAQSGDEMLSMFGDRPPGAVVLDVVMPGMDGYEACRRLRRLPQGEHLPVLMVTGKDDLESIDRAFGAGATDFMAKPINGAIMAHRLRYLLRTAETARSLRTSEQRLARAQRIARVGYWDFDYQRQQFTLAEEISVLLGLGGGCGCFEPQHALAHVMHEDRQLLLDSLAALQRGETPEPFFLRVEGPEDDRVLRVLWEPLAGNGQSVSGILQDVSEITSARKRIEYLALFDELTGLANRALFLERVREAMAAAQRYGRTGALLYLDVHHFKRVNDTLGLERGDRMLQEIALRLRRFVRECDVLSRDQLEDGRVSRLGGDEFCILLTEISRPEDAAQVIQRLDEAMQEPFEIDGQTVHIALRTGISVFPAEGVEPEELLKQAYTALSFAKDSSGAYQFYEQSMTATALSRLNLEHEIRQGIERGDFTLHYQPLVDLVTGRTVGVEALARWQHPVRGMVSPAEFIPVAEESGLIVPLGQGLVAEACRQGAVWIAQGFAPLRISVNISPRQFIDDDVCALLERVLAETGLPPQLLEVEVTESLLLDRASQADVTLRRIKEMGVGIAVDDFGTGYSSLSYLHAFPIDTLKIDRSFVSNGTSGGQAQAILRAIVAMGQSLELKILAEGVETAEQRQLLSELACHEAQGYLFSRPLPPCQLEEVFAAAASA